MENLSTESFVNQRSSEQSFCGTFSLKNVHRFYNDEKNPIILASSPIVRFKSILVLLTF